MDPLAFLAIDAVVCAGIGFVLLEEKGRGSTGLLLGLILGPIGLIIAAVMRLEPSVAGGNTGANVGDPGVIPTRPGWKRCRVCKSAHPVQDAKCRSCGTPFPAVSEASTSRPPATGNPAAPAPIQESPLKKCLDCAELIREDARKCRFCGRLYESESQVG